MYAFLQGGTRAFLFLPFLFLTGCGNDSLSSTIKSAILFKPNPVWLNKVTFVAATDINDSSPVSVNIVIPYTTDLLNSLSTLSANTYFQKKGQIISDNENNIDIFAWEIVSSQHLTDVPIKPSKVNGEGILVFAQYSSPGDHRATIGPSESALITLNKTDFTITSNAQ